MPHPPCGKAEIPSPLPTVKTMIQAREVGKVKRTSGNDGRPQRIMPLKASPQAGQPMRTGTTVEWPPCIVVNQVFDFQSEFVASCVENPAGREVSILVTRFGRTTPLLVVLSMGMIGGTVILPG